MTNLRDFAEKLYVSGTAQEMQIANDILFYIDFDMTESYHELCEEIDYYLKDGPPLKEYGAKVEYLGDRSNLLQEIEDEIDSDYTERLKMAGIEATDVDDIIRALLDRLPTEWDL